MHVRELKALRAVDGHQAHTVVVVRVVLVGIGEQGHVDEEIAQRAWHVGAFGLCIAELLHAGDQLHDVLVAAHAFGCLVGEELFQDARAPRDLFAEHRCAVRGQLRLEGLDHQHEIGDGLARAAVYIELLQVLEDHIPDRHLPFTRCHQQLVNRGLSDAARGIIDHALQGLFIARVAHQAEVADEVLDLFALVEAEAAVDAVGEVELAQRFLHAAALRVGAVQDGEALVRHLVLHLGLEDAVRHEGAFLVVAERAVYADLLALAVVGPDGLLDLVLVLLDERIGGAHDGLGAAVVLLELEELMVGVIVSEVEDVLDVGSAEGVDALAVVAHHGDVLVARGQRLHDAILHQVGVLVLIDEDVLEAALVLHHRIGMVAEEQRGVIEQVVEVHGACAEALHRVGLVDLAQLLAAHGGIAGHELAIGEVF